MTNMTHYDVIKKLLGPISPVGETREDERRLENLKATIEVIEKLVFDVSWVSPNKDRIEYSMKIIGTIAANFLKGLKDSLDE